MVATSLARGLEELGVELAVEDAADTSFQPLAVRLDVEAVAHEGGVETRGDARRHVPARRRVREEHDVGVRWPPIAAARIAPRIQPSTL